MVKVVWYALLFSALAVPVRGQITPGEIRQILMERIEKEKEATGMVVATVDQKGTNLIAVGQVSRNSKEKVDGDTVFEVGSVSKAFTGLLLANMVHRGEVKLDDPIAKYLPASVKVPQRKDRQITLLDLATHTSGLPRLPDNLSPADDQDPYADYTVEQMYEFLTGYTLTRDIGATYEYSNYGAGLLGHILGLRAGTTYESLLIDRICVPLKMSDTAVTLSASMKSRLAQGHNAKGRPVAAWNIISLAGAGGIRSTADDLVKLAVACLGLAQTPLAPAMELAETPRRDAGSKSTRMGLGWHITSRHGKVLIWHNGATGGYHSYLGLDKKNKRAVVVLANTQSSIDDIGQHYLESTYKLRKIKAAKGPNIITLDPKLLDRCVGRYQLTPKMFFNIRRAGDHLQVQLTGQSYLDIFPESETRFFCEVVDAQISFATNSVGAVTDLTLHQSGIDQKAPKISDEIPKDAVSIKLDPTIYDAYVGKYELAPGAIFTVRRSGDGLSVQLTGQSFLPVFPSSETKFFYKAVDAQLTFVKDSEGKVTSLILHQNGIDQSARRLP